ncbi:hypothetical protein HK101_010409 [Irineochytrium annulatum]|nr:hypothetical protein HK101_010409 [Irineochytrium annulatum]
MPPPSDWGRPPKASGANAAPLGVEAGDGENDAKDAPEKQKPNYGLSGALAAEQLLFNGVVLKYSEPPEARKPSKHFRFYIFKGKEQIGALCLFRQVSTDTGKAVKPYVIDLESANGTYINDVRIEPSRYYECKVGDTIKFGFSTREYVLMTEESAES